MLGGRNIKGTVWVTGPLVFALVFTVAVAPAQSRHERPRSYAPAFHRLARSGTVLVAGNWLLIDHSPRGLQFPTHGRLRNLTTGQVRQVVAPPDCMIATLSVSDIVFQCQQGPAAVELEATSGGSPFALSTGGQLPVAAGRYWLKVTPPITFGHQAAVFSFVNLRSGEIVSNPATVGGRTYTDLSAATLAETACSRVTVGEAYVGSSPAIGSLAFVGPLAIHYGGNRDRIRLQRCRQSRSEHVAATNFGFNRRALVWPRADKELSGIVGATGSQFAIRYPRAIAGTIERVALNGQDLYLKTARSGVWTARLPRSLRS